MTVPDEFTEEEKVSGMWWRQLVAGGGAGVGWYTTFPHSMMLPFIVLTKSVESALVLKFNFHVLVI